MKIKIDTVLKEKDKTHYWLAKEIGVTWQSLKKLSDNKTESVKFATLDAICKALDCKIEDIIEAE